MTLKDFILTSNNHFVASQLYKLFFKRVFLVLITKNYIIGLVCNNCLSVEVDAELSVTHELDELLIKRGSFHNPLSYLNAKMVKKVANKYLFDRSIFAVDKVNFRIDRNDIKTVTYNISKATYLGNLPSNGSIYIETINGTIHQFDLLGEQSGKDIVQWILTKHQAATLN
ncbi:MAG: hypothetical protein H7101_09710 [Deinococcales bacterium]|nr:hypothetical protein [Chitinophagaceae bacterium]